MKGEVLVLDETNFKAVSKEKLTEKYFDMIFRLSLSQTKDTHYAEDVCQDVFVKFLNSDKEFKSEEHVKAWLIRVTINTSKSVFTSSWHKKTVPLSESEDLIFETQEKGDVFYAVCDLPLKYRTVIHLFYYEDLSVAQIAKYLKTSENTVKSQLHRAREILREKLKGEFDFV